MQKLRDPRWLLLGAVLAVVCGCLALVGMAGGLYLIRANITSRTELPAVELTPGVLPDSILEQMRTIESQVAGLRGLPPAVDFERKILTPAELQERVSEDFFEEYTEEDARNDALVLAAFGLLDADFDLYTFYRELFSEQIAGFYDPETGEMVIVQEAFFRGPERLTYAHEYNHALQDHAFDLDGELGYNDESCEADTERCAAIQALIEGDSTKLEVDWFLEYGTRREALELQEYYQELESPIFDSAPAYLQDDFIFPYTKGLEFVEYLFEEGGWRAIDAAYGQPPVSTEQILHPDLFPSETPLAVSLPDLNAVLGDGWELLDEDVMGEWYTFLILARGLDPAWRLPDEEAMEAAAGWGGDAYAVYMSSTGQATVTVLEHHWDSAQDAREFADAFRQYASARFGSPGSAADGQLRWEHAGGVTLLISSGERTIWITAPELPAAQDVLSALQAE